MKQIFSLLLAGLFIPIFANHASAQGCVAIRSTGGICTMEHAHADSASKWVLNINNRYFKSFRHFVGTKEQKQKNHKRSMGMQITQDRIEIINKLYNMNASINIYDMEDELGNAKGTKVELIIPV